MSASGISFAYSMRFARLMLLSGLAMALLVGQVGCQNLDRDNARRYYELGQYDEAEQRFAAILADRPTDWFALYHMGLIRLQQDKPLDAEVLLTQAYRLRSDVRHEPDILDALAEALYRQERMAELHAMLRQAVANYGTSQDYVREAIYMGKAGDADAAAAAFRTAAQIADPDDARPFLAAADYYESIGNIPAAVTNLRHALYIRKNDPQIHARLRQHQVIPGPAAELPFDRD